MTGWNRNYLAFMLGMALISMLLNPSDTSGRQKTAIEPEVVATIGELVIREADLEEWLRANEPAALTRMKQEAYETKKRALDALIADHLLKSEAAKWGVTVEQLLASELPKRAQPVTDAEIKEVFDNSGPLPQGLSYDQAKPVISAYLQEKRAADARTVYVDELRESVAHKPLVRLAIPRQTVTMLRDSPALGNSSSKIEIVEFSDFQCSYCKQAAPTFNAIVTKYSGQVRLVWKDFPLPGHVDARPSAEAARCANEQGQFWKYHDVLFANQEALKTPDLKRYAAEIGLNVVAFADCLESGRYRDEVSADLAAGNRHGVSVTPTVFINGRVVVGAQDYQVYEKIILEEIAAER